MKGMFLVLFSLFLLKNGINVWSLYWKKISLQRVTYEHRNGVFV